MDLQARVSKDLLEAMKARDQVRVSAMRMLIAAFRNKEIERKKTLTDGEALDVVQAQAKQRRESMEEFKKAGRADLVAKEEAEYNVLKAYLPEPMSEADLKKLVESAVASSGAKGPQDTGRVMSVLMPQIKGRADGKQAQQLVQQALSASKA